MGYLIDTNAWIFYFQGDSKLGENARKLIDQDDVQKWVSINSIWEASIKLGIGKLKLDFDLKEEISDLLDNHQIKILEMKLSHAVAVKNLPPIHGDPFDRIQVCQAHEHQLDIVSADPIFERYGIQRHW